MKKQAENLQDEWVFLFEFKHLILFLFFPGMTEFVSSWTKQRWVTTFNKYLNDIGVLAQRRRRQESQLSAERLLVIANELYRVSNVFLSV
jgi:hypothetical protein